MRNHLHPLMKQRTSSNDANTLARRDTWVAELGPWSGSSNRVIRGLKPWDGVGESWAAPGLPASIRSHMQVEKCYVDRAALEEEIGDNIWKGD